jgi:hypothetical protein
MNLAEGWGEAMIATCLPGDATPLSRSNAVSASWVVDELQTVDLGDERLDARFEVLLSALGCRPNLSIPAACRGRAEIKAAYRFFDNDKVTFDKVLQPHIDQTLQRIAAQDVVLFVQDSTEADLTRPQQQVEGAGTLDGSRRGILLHQMQAFTPDGVPLGTVWAEILNRTHGVQAPRLGEMVRLIASLGGYVERKGSEPGPQTIWIGLQRLYDLAWAWETFGPESKLGRA